jgi:Flp pilus assembly protein TadD
MTTTTKTQSPASSAAVQPRTGFQPIPTRIRDSRDAQVVPPLVVESMGDAQKAQVRQTLGELGIKLAEIHRTAAEAYLSQGLYEPALPHLDAAATFAPTEIEYHNQLGFVRYVTGDDVGAIASFQRVIAGEPGNADAWFNLGMVLYGQNQSADAEGCFRRAIDNGADDAQSWNNRGVCLFQVQRRDEARNCFLRALKADPADQDARFNLASMG